MQAEDNNAPKTFHSILPAGVKPGSLSAAVRIILSNNSALPKPQSHLSNNGTILSRRDLKSTTQSLLAELDSQTSKHLSELPSNTAISDKNRKRSLSELQELARKRRSQKEENILRQQALTDEELTKNRNSNCLTLLDCLRNICKLQKKSVFLASDILTILSSDYKRFVDSLPIELGERNDSSNPLKLELRRILLRLVELAPEFISIDADPIKHCVSSTSAGKLESGMITPTVEQQRSAALAKLGSNADTIKSSFSAPNITSKSYIRINLGCNYSEVRSKLKGLRSLP
jgi:hypothetical protein